MMKLFFLILEVYSDCGTIEPTDDFSQVDVQAFFLFSIGIWTRYQSFNAHYYQNSWTVINVVSQSNDVALQLIIDNDDEKFRHTWSYTDGEGQAQQQQFLIYFKNEYGSYEGQWYLNHMSYDQQNLIFYLWPYGQDFQYIQNINIQGQIQLNDFFYYANSESNFQGKLSRIIQNIYFFTNQNLIDFVSSCTITQCIEQRQNIENALYFSQLQASYFDIAYQVHLKQNYSIGQWFKLEFDKIESIAQIFIFGVFSYQMYLFDDFYGQQGDYSVFKIHLNYNLFDLKSTSFQVNTYSYVTPIPGYNRERVILKIPILNAAYLQNWIYLEYQHFLLTSQILLYFSFDQSQQIYRFDQPIFHFSDLFGYIIYQIERDQPKNQLFIGYVQYVNFQDCFEPQNNHKIICSETCAECFGPLSTQCLSCNPKEESFRLFNPSIQSCECIEGYIDKLEKSCKSINQIFGYNIIKEVQKQGQQCQPGQFRGNNNKCFPCPSQFANSQNIICGNCYEDPQQINDKLQCTYDFIYDQIHQSYQKVVRKVQDYQIYLLNLDDGRYKYYQGAMGFCNRIIEPNCYFSSQYNFLGEMIMIQCLPNQISNQSQGFCLPCDNNCLVCNRDSNLCDQCESGFTLFKMKCVKCPQNCLVCQNLNDILIKCNSCITGYSNYGNTCYKCGSGCEICFQDNVYNYGMINRCVKCIDPYNYYISSDAENCLRNDIQNCLIQYVYYEQTKQSSFDAHLQGLNAQWQQPKCAKCQPGYINTITACILNQELDEQDQVVQIGQTFYKIMKQYDKDQLLKTKCLLDMCELCIFPYDKQQPSSRFCVQCQIGYYSHFINGVCLPCPTQCYKCIHQNKAYQDAWKWQVKAFSYFILNSFNSDTSPSDNLSNYEAICTECSGGLELYQGDCINPCDPTCEECIKVDGLNKCVRCRSAQLGQQLSIQDNKCIYCLSTCKFCISTQTVPQSKQYYNYFNQRCLIPQDIPKLTYQNYNYKICSENESCQKILNITVLLFYLFQLNVYCDTNQYGTDYSNSADKQNFTIYNILVSDLFVYDGFSNFGEIEKDYLLQYYNLIQLDIAYYYLNIIPDEYGRCGINHSTYLSSQLKNTVSGLQEIHLTLYSQSQVIIDSYLGTSFKSFSSLQFIRVGFFGSFATIYLNQIDTLIVKDSQFIDMLNAFIQFIALDVQFVFIENVYFRQFIFSMQNNVNRVFLFNNPKIVILNLAAESLSLIDTFIFQIDGLNGGSIQFTNLSLSGNYLRSSFMQINPQNTEFSILFENSSIQLNLDDSFVFQCPQLKNVSLNHIRFSNSIFQNSYFYQSLETQFSQVQFANIQLFSSYIYQSTTLGASLFKFENLTFMDVQYDNKSYIINIAQENGQIDFDYLDVTNLTCVDCTIGMYSLFTFQISKVNISHVNIEKTQGFNDIKLINTQSVIIRKISFTQNQQYKIFGLQKIDCLRTNLQNNIYQTGINIRNFSKIEIDDVSVIGVQTVNNPFIFIQQGSRLVEDAFTQINIQNCLFSNNQIIISNINILTSLILIQSDQLGRVSLKNINVNQNIMVDFIQDKFYDSALFVVVEAIYQDISLDKMNMSQNFVVNSSQSVIRFKAQLVSIQNSNFNQQNQYKYQIQKQWLFFGFDQDYQVYHETIQTLFPLNSLGGVSFIYARQILIDQCMFNSNRGKNGGSLYLNSLNTIIINNTQFRDSKAKLYDILQYQTTDFVSSGGALYIVSESSNLQLIIHNSSFIDCSASNQGGSIYIDLTISDVSSIKLTNLTIVNSISLQGSFIKISSSQNKQNLVYIEGLTITNTLENALEFLKSVIISNSDDIEVFINQNKLINIEFSSLYLANIYVTEVHFAGFLSLQNNYFVNINDVVINDTYIFDQTLMDIYQKGISDNDSYIKQFQIQNLQQSQVFNLQCQENNNFLVTAIENLKCDYHLTPKDLVGYLNPNQINNILNCNLNKLSQFSNNQYLIDISINIHKSQIQYQGFIVKNIKIPNFQGLWMISTQFDLNQLDSTNKNYILLQNIHISNCSCGLQGCLNIVGISSTRILQQLNIYQSLLMLPQTVKIYDSQFVNNTAYQGTLNINNVDVLINNTVISDNIVQTKGGGIYFEGNKKLYVYFTKISNNTALEGGAIYQQSQHQTSQISSELEMDSNLALQFSNGIVEFPKSLTIMMNNKQFFTQTITKTEQNYYEEIIIPKYTPPGGQQQSDYIYLPSGQPLQSYHYFDEISQSYLQYNLSLRIVALNSQNQIISNLNGTYCQLQGKSYSETNFSTKYFSSPQFLFDQQTNSYNLDDLIIYFNPYQQHYLIVEINCTSIKSPKYSNQPPYVFTGFYNNYKLYLKIKTFKCQRGEFYNQTDFSCKQCDSSQQFYSVIPGGKCQIKNDINTKSTTAARLELREGYWRPTETNDKISDCYHLQTNCLGGWSPGDKSCQTGHIGALCEQCDIYDTRGDGKFSISKEYQCGNCNQTNQNGLIIFFISLWTLLSILITVKGTVETVQWTTQQIKLSKIGLRMQIYRENNSSILVKLFTNYITILASISTFQLELPTLFGELVSNVGNPVQAMSYSLDCFLVDLTSIQIIYFRVIWAIIMPVIYSSAFLTCYIVTIKIKKAYYSFSVISTSIIYIYAYMQPNLIGAFISLLSYRNISNILWIQGNVAYKYLTQTHYNWIYGFLSPALLMFGFIIPLILFSVLKKNKHNLNNPKFRMVWGYMYNEYLDNSYFWEIIKICQREIIIIFLIFYQDQVVLKSALVFLLVILYDILAKYYLPYKTRKMNKLDSTASLICSSSIVSGQIIFAATQSGDFEITWPFYIFLLVVNALFILYMLLLILQSYLSRFNNTVESIKQVVNLRFPTLKYLHPKVRQFLEPVQNKIKRIQRLTQKIRKSLMPHAKQISMFKKQTTQNLSDSKFPRDQFDSKFRSSPTHLHSPKSGEALLLIQNELNTRNQEDEVIIKNVNMDEVAEQELQYKRNSNSANSNYVYQSSDGI